MTRGGRGTPDAATCRETTERPDQNARRRSARSRRATAPHNAQDRKGQRTSPMRGWRIEPNERHPRAKEATRSDQRPQRDRRREHGSYRQARRDQRALQGTRTSREASGRSCGTVSRRTCAAMTCTACTRPDRRRRLGYAVPERAVAGRCVEAQADVARPSRGRLTQRGPARQPDDPKAAQANTAARSSGGVSDRPPNARTRRTIGSATTRTLSGDQS
jgi:hypothetical protein